eukprot:CAMPEP_0201574568 /NCGR_PEP_ID=MMETSP0190_2-20130828/19142_1 /ASSEMBLY_ACC=CAM_ASM_000263 /TAXON_ID=37353 /ORGANISM="Rosalina sp." /LENGTH=166 /DNA_ID=CAMNT_0048002981 /DNA_START=234 /DNA_END=731 /DNA_ORIENTATION=+
MSFVYADDIKQNIGNNGYEGDALLFDRFNHKRTHRKRSDHKHHNHSPRNNVGITGRITLETNELIFTRQDWIKGERFRLCDVEISRVMKESMDEDDTKNNMNLSSTNSDTEEEEDDDEWGIKRRKPRKKKQNTMLTFQNGANCMTLVNMAVSELIQHTHSCSSSMW